MHALMRAERAIPDALNRADVLGDMHGHAGDTSRIGARHPRRLSGRPSTYSKTLRLSVMSALPKLVTTRIGNASYGRSWRADLAMDARFFASRMTFSGVTNTPLGSLGSMPALSGGIGIGVVTTRLLINVTKAVVYSPSRDSRQPSPTRVLPGTACFQREPQRS